MASPEIRVLIANDEPLARRVVRDLVRGYHDMQVVAEARNGVETVTLIRAFQPDLLFLDVRMPDLDGFGVLDALAAADRPATIFVTAYDAFAVRAFEQEALDYLVKPFTDERFHRTVARARRRLRQPSGGPRPPNSAFPDRLLAGTGRRRVPVALASVVWIEASDYCARLHTRADSFLVRISLNQLERRLDPAAFVRVHRGAIVNLGFVQALLRGSASSHELLVEGGRRIPVSSRRLRELVRRLGARRLRERT